MEGWEVFRDAHPNAVHDATVKLERAGKLLMVLTQNIDGLHAKAGTSAHRLVELHGTNAFVECQSCHARTDPEPHFAYFRGHRKAPRCNCGGFLKTATISFGQALDPGDLQRANKATQETDLVVAMGSTLSVYPAASFPLQAAERGIPYVIVNRGVTDHDDALCVSLRLEGEVSQIFPPAIEQALLAS